MLRHGAAMFGEWQKKLAETLSRARFAALTRQAGPDVALFHLDPHVRLIRSQIQIGPSQPYLFAMEPYVFLSEMCQGFCVIGTILPLK